eukprot:7276436-Karenia_brevis.AAC.1
MIMRACTVWIFKLGKALMLHIPAQSDQKSGAKAQQDQQQKDIRTFKMVRWEVAGNWGTFGKPSGGKG